MRYLSWSIGGADTTEVLAVSTEDGRVLFYSTSSGQPLHAEDESNGDTAVLQYHCLGSLGGKELGSEGRVKDFECIEVALAPQPDGSKIIITAGSDGIVSLWQIESMELSSVPSSGSNGSDRVGKGDELRGIASTPKINSDPQVGHLLGKVETGNRVTCLKAFLLRPSGLGPEPVGEALYNNNNNEGDDFEGFSPSEDEQ